MCGIVGFTRKYNDFGLDVLTKMNNTMIHRGPDGAGAYVDEGIALGHRRLAFIDIENGKQPMLRAKTLTPELAYAAEDGSIRKSPSGETVTDRKDGLAIVFNGEIYNYADIREELVSKGYEFTTDSDTEVILASYLEWGKEMVKKFRGMFAFALWDSEKKTITCGRDWFGIKPFYYSFINGDLVFASEAKAILEFPEFKKELNKEALEAYLCFEFPALEETFFKGIFKLPPAHTMTIGSDGEVKLEKYWDPMFKIDNRKTEKQFVDETEEIFKTSIRYHNVADVEVGSFLSSGIDSSYMAACLFEENPDMNTFTVGFDLYSGERDEVYWAAGLAKELGMKNKAEYIKEEDYWDILSTVQWHMDEPLGDPSAIALYFVDKNAASTVKAVLSGEGADEFFGGYKIYQTAVENQKLGWVPNPVLKGAAKVLDTLHIRGGNYLRRAAASPKEWYYTNANGAAFSYDEMTKLINWKSECKTPLEFVAPYYKNAEDHGLGEAEQMQYVDCNVWLVNDILLKTDKMSMAHSLESRVPFMDTGVFGIANTIPTAMKMDSVQTKKTLRQDAGRMIPEINAQKQKLGFPVPLIAWLREEGHYEDLKAVFEGETAKKFFDSRQLVALLDEHRKGERDLSRRIWIVYMFLVWYNVYFEDGMSKVKEPDLRRSSVAARKNVSKR